MRKIMAVFFAIIMLLSLVGCGQKHVCQRCDRAVSDIYYDIDGVAAFCKDCAREYWAPFNYKEYRVRN